MEYLAYIGLGSNLASEAGSPTETVLAAMEALSKIGTITARSSLYQTAPVSYREQPDFTNAVVSLKTGLEPEALLGELLNVERSFGRDRRESVPKGPRTLDLDLLLLFADGEDGGAILSDSPTLTLPHSGIANRGFVLEPLAEISPGLRHPVLGSTALQLLEHLRDKESAERTAHP
jgi:2-amino-4-hydroxy-6-hydroxymethyldihydropteridine diphosphokinase